MTMLDDDELTEVEPDTDALEISASSVLDGIKRRRDERVDPWFDIPTWGGELKAKYRIVDPKEVRKMINRIRSQGRGAPKDGGEADADFIINACVAVHAFPLDREDYDEDEGIRVSSGFDQELVEALEIQARNPRELIGHLFKGNKIAVSTHAQKVARWMQDTSKDIEDPT